jgi:ABC-2 type transport system permease protein
MIRFIRSAFVIARRDFGATVLSKTFIFFLLGPMFPLLLGGVFGGIGAQVASRTERSTIAVSMSQSDFTRVEVARDRLAQAIGETGTVRLIYAPPSPADAGPPERQLSKSGLRAMGLLTGQLGNAQLTGSIAQGDPVVGQIRLILEDAQTRPELREASRLTVTTVKGSTEGALDAQRAQTAQIGQVLLFFLTLMLSTMVLSQLIEEKSNKVIEIIAAAIPIDAMFVGKLFAMLAASVLALVVWISAGALLIQMITTGGVRTLPAPAVGWPAFLALGVAYFGMNYLLFGAAFLMIGAQASTAREVQTLSLPATFGQVLLFGLASTAVGAPDSANALAAAAFPLSSPMAMLARAAERPDIWPHFAALLWQALWVALILRLGAHLFRKTVLKSGPRKSLWRRRSVA